MAHANSLNDLVPSWTIIVTPGDLGIFDPESPKYNAEAARTVHSVLHGVTGRHFRAMASANPGEPIATVGPHAMNGRSGQVELIYKPDPHQVRIRWYATP